MSIGRIMQKAFTVLKSTKTVQVAAKGTEIILPKANVPSSILSRVETNTSGRILRMQEAKRAFAPRKPYQTTVVHENAPTLQKIEEITGVSRGKIADTTGYFDKKRAADALAAFKHEPVQVRYGTYTPNYQSTQQVIDELREVARVDALKAYEKSGKLIDLPREAARRRLDAQAAFAGDLSLTTPNWLVKMDRELDNMILTHQKKWDNILSKKFAEIDAMFANLKKFG